MSSPETGAGSALAEQARPTALEETIVGQPAAISAALTANADAIRTASAMVAAARRVRLCGVGASGHAAQVGEHLLRSIGVDARAVNAFDLAVYPTNFDPGELLIVYTHRGGTNYTTRALGRAIRSGLKTIAITGRDAEGVRADVGIATVPLERSATHTVSFTAAMAATAAICARCEPRSPLATAMPTLGEYLRAMLPSREVAREVAAVMSEPERRTLICGAGALHPIARGGALSVKEAAYLIVEGNHLEDAIHGGLHGLNAFDVLVQIAPDGAANDRQEDLAGIADALHLRRWKIGGPPLRAQWHTPMPAVPETLAPILATIPLHWLALECAHARGTNPDVFRRDDPLFQAAYPSTN
jgi:glucosamine--fructose-6-phosphate aminotransferase (isomerizing)